uniref:Low-density lipoprotein receptor n=1 Tax=Rodentolepis nana TaxID=102285 RepID=A0A0R3T0K6_RODNA
LDGLAVDWIVGNLYWSTGGNRQIWVSRLDGAWPRLLLTLEDFDAGAGSSASGGGDKESADVLGDPYSDETHKRRPTALAIDPINRYLFFNVWSGTRGRIERTWLDGTHREVIVDHNHTVWPNGIALDFESRHLYYVDAYLGVISRVDYSGANPKQIVSGHLQHPFGFDLLGDNLYWSDWQTLSISQVNKRTGEDLRVLKTISVDEALMGIRAVDLSAKNTYKGNICGDKSRSGCSHLCFMLPSQQGTGRSSNLANKHDEADDLYYCACPPEYALDSDGKTCIVPDSMLLYSLDGTGIRRMSLPKSRQKQSHRPPPVHHPGNNRRPSGTAGGKGYGLTNNDVELAAAETSAMASNQIFNQVPLPFMHRVIRFDVHISEERIYWVEDSAPQCISVAFLNGTGKETLLCLFHDTVMEEFSNRTVGKGMGESDTSQPPPSGNTLQARDSIVGLALDWLTNALYFCVDGERPRLEVIDLKYRNYLPSLSPIHDSSVLPLYSPPVPQHPSQRGSRPRKTPTASRSRGNWHSNLRVRRDIVPPWFLPFKGSDPVADAYDLYTYDFNPVTDRLANSVDNYRLVLLHNLSSPRDIVVHPKKRYLFWLDGTHNARFNIFSAGLDGRNHRLIWNGVGMVMSLAIDYTADRLYWMNWVTKCIESITLNGEDWFSVNPQLPSDHGTLRNSDYMYDDSSPRSSSSSDFHPYAIDVFQGSVLFSELTTQSVYRVQIPSTRNKGNQFNVAADLLLRGAASPSGRQNFLVLGLFVAGFDRQAAEPGHRCAPPSSNLAFYSQAPAWNYPYSLQNPPNQPHHQQSGPICQALCLGAPSPHSVLGSRGNGGSQQSVFRTRGGIGGGYPPPLIDDRSPRFTCACPTQFTLASDGYSCLEPQQSLLIITTDGLITRYTPDDQPTTNLLSLSPLTLPIHDQLSADAPPPTWQPVEQVSPPYVYAGGSDSTFNEGDPDVLTDPLVFARRWIARHRVAATALEEVTNAGLFFLLQPVGGRERVASSSAPLNSPPRTGGRNFRHASEGGGRNSATRGNSFTERVRAGVPFMRLGFLEFATGEVTLWEGGPLVPLPESGWNTFIPSGGSSNSQPSSTSQQSNAISFNRPRWSLAFDPVNQIVFWSDAVTGLLGAENSRSGRTIGLVANLTENSRTVLEIVVEPRSGQLFQLTSKKLEFESQPTECRIEATYLDGSDRRIVYDASKTSSCPHSLTYSAKLAQLFWVDPSKKRICTVSVATALGNGALRPETVVLDTFPIPKSLVILPESGRGSPSSSDVLWLTWLEPINHGISFGGQNHPMSLLYVPLDSVFSNTAPIAAHKPLVPPPGLNSFLLNSGSQLFLVPVRGGGLGDLSWHPCAGPSHGECSQFCLPKATASSPSLPLYPGPLTPHPPLSSPQPQSLWRTVRKCACALGSQLLNTGSQSDEGNVCSRIPYCLPPNMLCRVGLTTRGKKARAVNYFLLGEPFPQKGACIPAHKVCDGVADCLDGSDEVNCPQACPEYECDNGLCLPFSSRCNDVIECDSDESCCGKDQFECRRPRHSLLLYQQYPGTPSSRCLPSALVCNGRPDCPDGWDEASCDEHDVSRSPIGELEPKNGVLSSANLTGGADSLVVEVPSKPSGGEFPFIYIIFIVSAIVVGLIIIGIVTYLCSKNWSKSSYTVHTDVLLLPAGKREKGRLSGDDNGTKCINDSAKARGDCQEPLVGGKTTIKSSATLTEHTSTANSRSRRYIGGSSRRITSKVTVLPSPPVNDASNWYCPSCSSKGGAGGCSVQSPSAPRTYCIRCQKHSRHHSRNQKSSRTRSPCQCGTKVSDAGDNSSVYWNSRCPSKCPPAPPPSSLPSPPPSPTTASCLFDNGPTSNTCHPPPAPPPSKLHADNDDDVDEYGEELAGSSSTTPSCELSDSSSLTASPLRCRHSHHRRRRHRPSQHHHRRRFQRHEPSVSSVTSVDHSAYQYPATTSHRRSRHRAGSGRRMRRRKVSFRSDLDECGGHCPQCGSRQRHHSQQGSSSRKNIMRRNTFATTATGAVQQHTLETVNPPPSPITESIYASLPLAVLKHSEIMSQNARLSNSSGSNGVICNDGVNSLSFETLGNDKEYDRRLISTVGNLGRSSVGASAPPFYCPPGEDSFGIPKQLQMPSSAVGSLATTSSLPSACLPTSHRHNHKHISGSGANDVNTTLTAVTASSAAKTTTTTTTTIQNVHVVIVTSNKEQKMHHHRHECCDCCSDYSLTSCSSDSEGPPPEATPHQFPALMVAGGGDLASVIPEEPREQAEGAEADEEINPPARAPFAQFSSKNA